ncbi:hypothetical protein Bpfe_004471 [Biomphalaria pfeifferi]|uniref:Uncharacterized protein n=1 Tax=Biomphalaria pfeifferi TaxID=112525 RepID=A0AAD8FJ81_BIOPF|nr:hypothetical protein Bpfe_004471 [Biomphalaria pfeifferi]
MLHIGQTLYHSERLCSILVRPCTTLKGYAPYWSDPVPFSKVMLHIGQTLYHSERLCSILVRPCTTLKDYAPYWSDPVPL